MVEITFRPGSYLGSLSKADIESEVIEGLTRIKLIEKSDIVNLDIRTEKYAYVIYDLDHRKNTDLILNYLKSIGIASAGRFAEFEYLNTDVVVERTIKLAGKINIDSTSNTMLNI